MNGQILGRNTDLNCYWSLEVWKSGIVGNFWNSNGFICILQHRIWRRRLLLLLLRHFSRVRLCATPETPAHQAPPSLGFSRQEHWSGLWRRLGPLIDKHQTPQPSYWLPSCPEPHPSTFCNMIWVGRGLKAVNEEGLVQGGCQFM